MKNKKLVTLITITLLFGLTACSNQQSKDKNATPTTVITEPTKENNTPTEAITEPIADPDSSNDKIIPSDTKKALTTYYETIGTIDDAYEFAASYVDTITSKDQIAEYAANHNLPEYEVADLSGNECYLIIPKYKDTSIKVEMLSEPGCDTGTELLSPPVTTTPSPCHIESTKPVFVLCNPSDIWSNAQITVTHDGVNVQFSPYISLKDGTPVLPLEANLAIH